MAGFGQWWRQAAAHVVAGSLACGAAAGALAQDMGAARDPVRMAAPARAAAATASGLGALASGGAEATGALAQVVGAARDPVQMVAPARAIAAAASGLGSMASGGAEAMGALASGGGEATGALASGGADATGALAAGAGAGSAQHETAALAGRAKHGALFRVSRDGQTTYLFGTVHVGRPDFYPLPTEVTHALAEARTLVVELDTRADAAFQTALARHGAYPAGDTVRRHLRADTLARLIPALQARGYDFNSVAHLKPWLLANLLAGAELDRAGFHRSEGLEFFLLGQAQRQGARVAELESAELQLALFDTMDEQAAEDYLRETLADIEDGSSLAKSRALLDAWYTGDAAAQDSVWRGATEGSSVSSAFTRKVLLGQRNPEMAAGIERIMQAGGTSFVGVGLLHLLGDDGLPRLLAQRGYSVERVY